MNQDIAVDINIYIFKSFIYIFLKYINFLKVCHIYIYTYTPMVQSWWLDLFSSSSQVLWTKHFGFETCL